MRIPRLNLQGEWGIVERIVKRIVGLGVGVGVGVGVGDQLSSDFDVRLTLGFATYVIQEPWKA